MADREGAVSLGLFGLLALAPVAAWAAGEVWYVNLSAKVAVVALAAAGLNLALGMGGMVSFGHAAFFGLGGYVAGVSAAHALDGSLAFGVLPGTDSLLAIWPAAMLLAALVALPIGWISLRTQGVEFIMITLAFAQMVYFLAVAFPAYGGEDGLPIALRNTLPWPDTGDPLTFALLSVGLLGLVLLLTARLMGSRFGAALTMARLNPVRLATAGIEPLPVKLVAFVLSAAVTGLAGALFADLNGYVSPAMLSWARSGELMVIVILGGVGRVAGPVAGAAAFVLLETFLGGLTERWLLFLGLILLLVVLFARGGIMGLLAGPARHD